MSGFENGKRRIKVRNTSDAIRGTLCNGCDWLEVLVRRHRWHEEERYYCNKCGMSVDPKRMDDETCRKFGELRRRFE